MRWITNFSRELGVEITKSGEYRFSRLLLLLTKKKIKNASPKFQSNSQIKIFLNKIRNVSMTHFKEFLAVYSTKKPKYRLGDNIPNALSRYTK